MESIKIKIFFIREEGHQSSSCMLDAFQTCREILETTVWIDENDLDITNLSKRDYLVFENFNNRDFKQFEELSSCPGILGPLAISTCLLEGKSVPPHPWPIFNVSMYDCIVTFSGMPKVEKRKLTEKVQRMGGFVTDTCTAKNTHLVANKTQTDKYTLAVENNMKILSSAWVEQLWELSQTTHVDAKSKEFMEKYKLPCFHNLVICTTGITDRNLKENLAKTIADNGGEMVNKLKLASTDILIVYGNMGLSSEKYKAAKKVDKISCVIVDWIYDSVKQGCALPPQIYKINKEKTSTPKKDGENVDPNFSTISMIGGPNVTQKSEIEGTINRTDTDSALNSFSLTSNTNKRKASNDLIEKLDLKKVKTAGHFLDGCSIYLAGFSFDQQEKLNKIINLSGATRYSEISERVTHVIVDDNSCQEVANIRNMRLPSAIVSIQWLLDSISKQQPVNEDNYLLGASDLAHPLGRMGSPLSQKALSLLRTNSIVTEAETTTVPEPAHEPDDDVLQQWGKRTTNSTESEDTLAALLKDNQHPTFKNALESERNKEFSIHSRTLVRNSPKVQNNSFDGQFKPNETSTQIQTLNQPEISTQVSEVSSVNPSEDLGLFSKLKFVVAGFDEENTQVLIDTIEAYDGQMLKNDLKGIADYAVVPMFKNIELIEAVKNVVNNLWVEECVTNMALIELDYFYKPLPVSDTKPLENCVITTTTYSGPERQFLNSLAWALGAVCQDQFSKKPIESKGILASTHLISPEPSGKKYEGAIKWNRPVVSKDWLLECAKNGIRVSEQNFLVEGSTLPEKIDSKKTELQQDECQANDSSRRELQNRDIMDTGRKKLASTSREPSTPITKKSDFDDGSCPRPTAIAKDVINTPVNRIFNIAKDTPESYSQITPVNKILQDAIDNNLIQRNVDMNTPKGFYPWDPKTPETPLGQFITPNPSRSLRKEMQRFIDSIPEFEQPKRRLSTPLSELRRRFMDKGYFKGEFAPSSESADIPTSSNTDTNERFKDIIHDVGENRTEASKCHDEKNKDTDTVDTKLQKFQEMLKASGSGSGVRKSMNFESTTSLLGAVEAKNDIQSQICTVGWDYGELEPKEKVFMLSGVDASVRVQVMEEIEELGAKVIESGGYDESATHLLCQKPSRNEKCYGFMAAGKWILHLSYIEKSVEAGKFLDEELHEFGNPKSKNIIQWSSKEPLNESAYYWRMQMKEKGTRAFHNMRAIVVAGDGRDKLVRVIEAGGGVIVNVKPPYHDTVNATHCLLEVKSIEDYKVYIPLAKQGIKCLNTIFLDSYLKQAPFDIKELYLPELAKYHNY